MKDTYLFISLRTSSYTHGLCCECIHVKSCHIKYVCNRPAVSKLDDIPGNWFDGHTKGVIRDVCQTPGTLSLLSKTIPSSLQLLFSLHAPSFPYRVFAPSSCYPNELDFHINILTLTNILIGHVSSLNTFNKTVHFSLNGLELSISFLSIDTSETLFFIEKENHSMHIYLAYKYNVKKKHLFIYFSCLNSIVAHILFIILN